MQMLPEAILGGDLDGATEFDALEGVELVEEAGVVGDIVGDALSCSGSGQDTGEGCVIQTAAVHVVVLEDLGYIDLAMQPEDGQQLVVAREGAAIVDRLDDYVDI